MKRMRSITGALALLAVALCVGCEAKPPEYGREFVRSMAGVATVLFTVRPDRWLTADFSDEV